MATAILMIIHLFGTRWKTSGLAHVFWHSVACIALHQADAKPLFFIETSGLHWLGLEEESTLLSLDCA